MRVQQFVPCVIEIPFSNGVATVDGDTHAAALRYFRQAGYGVEELADEPAARAADDTDKLPAKSASKVEWKAYAIAHGVDEAEAEKTSRDDLAARFHAALEGGAS